METEELMERCSYYASTYHPYNIPDEIKKSKLVNVWFNIYINEFDPNAEGSSVCYIFNIKPANNRKNTIIEFNELMRKYDWPCEGSAYSRHDKLEYITVRLCWYNFYRCVDENRKILKSKKYKNIISKAILSRLDAPAEIFVNYKSSLSSSKYFYVPNKYYEASCKEDVTNVHAVDFVGCFNDKIIVKLYGHKKWLNLDHVIEVSLTPFYESYTSNVGVDSYDKYKQAVIQLENVKCYDSFVLDQKLKKLEF